jgi:L-lactate dehydrogenase
MKVGVVGAGFVGAASAYAMAIRGSASDVVIIDVNKAKAEAEARDIAHATTFTHPVRVTSGDFPALAGAKVVIMSAGVNQKPGETRLELLGRNAAIFRSVIPQIVANAPGAIILVSANPVDIMTELSERIAYAAGAAPGTVMGTGTVLDTARFRQLVGQYLHVSNHHVHGYVYGEHGDSEVLGWSSMDVGGLSIEEYARTTGEEWNDDIRARITDETVHAAYAIIEGKGATYFGIGASTARLVEAILRDEHAIYSVTATVESYGCSLALPRIVTGDGLGHILYPTMNDDEKAALDRSASVLREFAQQLPAE